MPEAPFQGDPPPPPPEFNGQEFLVENGVPLRVALTANETGYFNDFMNKITGVRLISTTATDQTLSAESRATSVEKLQDEQEGLAGVQSWADYVRFRIESPGYFPQGVPSPERLDRYAEPFSRLPRADALESIVQTIRGYAVDFDGSSTESLTALRTQLLEQEAQAHGIVGGRDAEIDFRQKFNLPPLAH